MREIDLNSDLGESFGAYTIGMDAEVLAQITSANIACGFHAGDPLVMARTVALARAANVSIGAHPGFPDLAGFGRRAMKCSPAEIKAYVQYQIGALQGFAVEQGMQLQHVKAHGALYNMAVKDLSIGEAIATAVAAVDRELILLCPYGSAMAKAGEKAGLRVACEVFADRAYQADGSLVPRTQAGAIIHDRAEAVQRTVRMVLEGSVTAISGEEIPIRADSVCVHGDNPEALAFTRDIHRALEDAGVTVAPFASFL